MPLIGAPVQPAGGAETGSVAVEYQAMGKPAGPVRERPFCTGVLCAPLARARQEDIMPKFSPIDFPRGVVQ